VIDRRSITRPGIPWLAFIHRLCVTLRRHRRQEDDMRKHAHTDLDENPVANDNADEAILGHGLPRRLLTAFEVAEFVGCHEETVRRAYRRGLFVSQRFGVRSRRFHPRDVHDWIRRGAPTRVS
jgi:excisionase family DNA binding protein